MAARYWVGGAGTWSSGNTANWSATSGGAGGASVPTSADTPTFDANSGSGVVTFTNSGVTVSTTTIDNSAIELSLGAAFSSIGTLILTNGVFTSNNYNVSAFALSSNNSNARTINLGSSTVTLSGGNTVLFTTSTNLAFNAGTSQVNCSATSWTFNGGGQTFYNVSFTSGAQTAGTVNGANTFNNLTIAGRTTVGVASIGIASDQTINGTLTLSAGTNATYRTFLRGSVIGTTYTLTCAAVSATDADFRDITIAGAAAPVSGTRLGDCKGNSGITFDAPKTVYFRGSAGSTFAGTVWATTPSGSPALSNFPLAQDTAVYQAAQPISGQTHTINAAYNIGTIDMSARTSNTMTLATGTQTPTIYGNWINGTGTTLTGTGVLTFAGRGSQMITSAGKTFTQRFIVDTVTGVVSQTDSIVISGGGPALQLTSGTYDANNYNFTSSGNGVTGGVASSGTTSRTLAIGSATWTIAAQGLGVTAWQCSNATNLTVTGTGTISLTSASVKTFAGGGIQTYPTINQGGTGTLTITGSNKFAGITNTAIGAVWFNAGNANSLLDIAWNGVGFVAVGTTGTIITSPDRASWVVRQSGSTATLTGVAWSGSKFVVCGLLGTILTSPDGITWTPQTSGVSTTINLTSVTWNGSQFVVVGTAGTILTSPDGITWTQRTGVAGITLNSTAWDGSQFVLVGQAGIAYTSPDGVTWTSRTSGTGNTLLKVTWGGSKFVAVGVAGTILTSPDGITWTPQTSSTTNVLNSVIWAGSLFVAPGVSGTLLTSPDGITWTAQTSNTTGGLYGVVWSGSLFVAVGSSGLIDTSSNAINWTPIQAGYNEFTEFNLSGVAGNLLQVGSTNTTQATLKKPGAWNVGANSTDAGNNTGLSFTAGTVDYLSVSYINGQIVAGATSNIYYNSINISEIYYGNTLVESIYYGSTQVY